MVESQRKEGDFVSFSDSLERQERWSAMTPFNFPALESRNRHESAFLSGSFFPLGSSFSSTLVICLLAGEPENVWCLKYLARPPLESQMS